MESTGALMSDKQFKNFINEEYSRLKVHRECLLERSDEVLELMNRLEALGRAGLPDFETTIVNPQGNVIARFDDGAWERDAVLSHGKKGNDL